MIADIGADGAAIIVIAQTTISNRRRTYEDQNERQGWRASADPHASRFLSRVKAGALANNYNRTLARDLKFQSQIRAGVDPPQPDWRNNHNQTVARDPKIRTNIKAGGSR